MKRKLLLLFLCGLFGSAYAEGDLLGTIFQQLGQRQSYKADYVEKKYLSILDVPLAQSGQLDFLPPDTMVRKQNSPKLQTFTVSGNRITIESANETRQVDLERVPALQAFVLSMQAVLSGDVAKLKRYYSVVASGDINNWQLHLTPLQKQLANYIVSIRFDGKDNEVTAIRIDEVGGDWSEMALQPVDDAG